MNPKSENLISPKEAMITPMTMKLTLLKVFSDGGVIRRAHVASNVATGVVACQPC
jgi:hypothetical protein